MQWRSPNLNMIQKCCRLVWAKAHLKWSLQSGNCSVVRQIEKSDTLFLTTMGTASAGLQRRGTFQLVFSTQFKSLHNRWLTYKWATHSNSLDGNVTFFLLWVSDSPVLPPSIQPVLASAPSRLRWARRVCHYPGQAHTPENRISACILEHNRDAPTPQVLMLHD